MMVLVVLVFNFGHKKLNKAKYLLKRSGSTMLQKKYTKEFKQQIVDLYNMGNKSLSELENEYGV